MNVIGEAFIAVHMTATEADVKRSVESATKPALASVEKQAADTGKRAGTSLGSHLGTGAKIAAAGGLVALGAGFRTGLGEVEDYQKGLAQLTQGLKTTGNVAGISAPQMEDLATKIQDYSGQTDDSIVATEQLLLTFTNIRNEAGKNNDIFTQTTKIAADMAARLGGDASGAAVQLGKALNDPIKGVSALGRVGVSFTEGQKKQIKALVDSGHTMKAQKIILAELNKEFGGSAKAVGSTLPGQIERGKRSYEDLTQTIVGAVLPSLISTATFITQNADVILPLVGAVAALVAGYKVYTIVTRVATAVQALLNGTMEANPIGLVVVAIAALVAGLIIAYKRSQTFRNIVQAAMHGAAAAIHAVVNAGEAVVGWFKRNWQYVVAGLIAGPFGLAVVFIAKHWDQIINGVKSIPGRVRRAAVGMFDGIKDAFRSAINWVIDKLNGLSFGVGGWKIAIPHAPDIHVPRVNVDLVPGKIPYVPGFASGGTFGPGLALVGEEGPELVSFHGRGQVHSNAQTNDLFDGIVAELRRQSDLLNELAEIGTAHRNDTRQVGPAVAGALNSIAAGADLAAAGAVGGW